MAMLFLRMLSQTCYAQRICADTNSSCARNVRRNGEKNESDGKNFRI